LAIQQVDSLFVRAYVNALLPGPTDADKIPTQTKNAREKLTALINGGQLGGAQVAVQGTIYGALQAAVEYADWHRPIRLHAGVVEAEHRMESILMGPAAAFKEKAVRLALGADTLIAEARSQVYAMPGLSN
jgi:hypothetical protein